MSTSKPHIAQDLLSRAHSPDTAEQLFTERIKQKPLYLRPTSPTPADKRSRRRLQRLRKKEYFYRKQRPQPLSARQKRVSGLYDISKEECKYEVFKGLHGMWVQYMQEVLGIEKSTNATNNGRPLTISGPAHGSKLVSADYHGAEVEVVRSRCAGRVGVKGIVIRDTKFTFVIVTEKDVVKTIPKEHTVFRFTIPSTPVQQSTDDTTSKERLEGEKPKDFVFELHGSQFENRPVDRANKKFKWRNIDYV
ncbi:uncharacterized protein BHQ10_005773 [Talaromyces amestolkiae]|uniref:Ribonuclease P protein subunit n=1 Tax=Talaromyces amestolkiae TaxID=1196081 RepID=A0A364L208_TALAM|nr:uncharacterized protein BHQ10_005773 [Talaromyces amestolkiae]RAO69761.1 hypothetical protein BHQ10_005773 [Talaromyces amestolkiae]